MKTKVMLVSLLAMAGFVFNSCDDGETGDTQQTIIINIYPSDSPNVASEAEKIREMYAAQLSSIGTVSMENASTKDKVYATYNIKVDYNMDKNGTAFNSGITAVKNSTSTILSSMPADIWEVSATTNIDASWDVEKNMAKGTWKGTVNGKSMVVEIPNNSSADFTTKKSIGSNSGYKYYQSPLTVTYDGKEYPTTAYYFHRTYDLDTDGTPYVSYEIDDVDGDADFNYSFILKCYTSKTSTLTVNGLSVNGEAIGDDSALTK